MTPCIICGESAILDDAGVCYTCRTYRPTHNRFGEPICPHGRTKDQDCPYCMKHEEIKE